MVSLAFRLTDLQSLAKVGDYNKKYGLSNDDGEVEEDTVLDGVAVLVNQALLSLDGTGSDRGENDSADTLFQAIGSDL